MSGWIDIEDSLPQHRKTLEVADDLDIEPVQLVGHLTCFWLWAINNADNDGLLAEGIRPRTIARAAMWTGDAERFVDALLGRFLDVVEDDRLRIHDWDKHFGKWAEKREEGAERKRRWRERQQTQPAPSQNGTPQGPDADATETGHVTIPDLTGPNRTVDTECLTVPSCAEAREVAAPEPTARAAPDDETPPKWQEVAPGQYRCSPNGKPEARLLPVEAIEVCPACRQPFDAALFEAHFQACSKDVPKAEPGAVAAWMSGRGLRRPPGKLAAAQPERNEPLTPEQIAEWERTRPRGSPKPQEAPVT